MNRGMVQINGDKLKAEIAKRNLLNSHVSREIGMNDSFISNSCARGKISRAGIVLLDNMFNIKLENYILEQPKPEEPALEPQTEEKEERPQLFSTKEELYQLIYSAVYEAVKKAWSE